MPTESSYTQLTKALNPGGLGPDWNETDSWQQVSQPLAASPSIEMQTKHQAFFSRNPSGLNPNRLSLFKGPPLGTFQRGTVSMPSSPLLGVQSTGNFGNMGAVLDTVSVFTLLVLTLNGKCLF